MPYNLLVAETGFEPRDLWVMSPTSCQLLHSAICGYYIITAVVCQHLCQTFLSIFLHILCDCDILTNSFIFCKI